jgi:hypothetical protein
VLLDGFVVGVEGGFEEEDGGDATGHFLDARDFTFGESGLPTRLRTGTVGNLKSVPFATAFRSLLPGTRVT